MQTIDSIKAQLQKVMERYSPDKGDMIPGGPDVTWAEEELAEALYSITQQVQALTYRIQNLEDTINRETSKP